MYIHDHVENRQPVGSCYVTQGTQPGGDLEGWDGERG